MSFIMCSLTNTSCLTLQMCIDPTLSVALGDKPPPLYICEECSQRIAGYATLSFVFSSSRSSPALTKMPFQTYIT